MDTSPSKHHIFFEKRSYSGREQKSFRNHPGLVIKDVPRDLHDELHLHVPSPAKPTAHEMGQIITNLEAVPSSERQNPFWGLLSVVDYYEALPSGNREVAAHSIAQNMLQQLCVLALSMAST